jgi:predicted O-methyltransferase YrrM
LLHIDVDLYEPTLSALQHLYPLVSPGGVVIIDEYALAHWGATEALQDYFQGKLPNMQKLNFYTNPGGFFIKPSEL